MHVPIPKFLGTLLAGISACAVPSYSQDPAAIGGFTLGYVFDRRSSGLKPLVGIPGAAVLAAQLDAGVAIRQAYVSPRQNYAVALTDDAALLVIFHSATDPPGVSTLGFPSSSATVVALSPDGSAGAFYSASEAVIRVVTGLPSAPAIVRSVPATATSGSIRLLAVSNDAAQIVAATDADGSCTLSRIDPDGSARTLAGSTHISALQFMGESRNLLVSDDADNTVSMVQDVSGSAALQLLAGAADGISGPAGLDVSLDGKLVIVADSSGRNVLVFDSSGSQRAMYPCPCTPAGLGRLNGNSVFLLNGLSDSGPLWLFDGDNATPRVLFVPAGENTTAGSDQ